MFRIYRSGSVFLKGFSSYIVIVEGRVERVFLRQNREGFSWGGLLVIKLSWGEGSGRVFLGQGREGFSSYSRGKGGAGSGRVI